MEVLQEKRGWGRGRRRPAHFGEGYDKAPYKAVTYRAGDSVLLSALDPGGQLLSSETRTSASVQ